MTWEQAKLMNPEELGMLIEEDLVALEEQALTDADNDADYDDDDEDDDDFGDDDE